jgi:hypothetical protein
MARQRAGATEVVAELPVGGRPAETARRASAAHVSKWTLSKHPFLARQPALGFQFQGRRSSRRPLVMRSRTSLR